MSATPGDRLLELTEAARAFSAAVEALDRGERWSVSRYQEAEKRLVRAALAAYPPKGHSDA